MMRGPFVMILLKPRFRPPLGSSQWKKAFALLQLVTWNGPWR